MIDTINIMIPSYRRDRNLIRCLDSFRETAEGSLVFTILVNEGEHATHTEVLKFASFCEHPVFLHETEKGMPHLGRFYNELYRYSLQDRNIAVSMIGDDMVCQTPGWDREIKHALNKMDGMGIVHCRDGIQNGQIAVNLFTTRDWVDHIGGTFMDERFAADYIDVIHTERARSEGKGRYLDHVYIEHRHWSKTGEMDETALRLRQVWRPAEEIQ